MWDVSSLGLLQRGKTLVHTVHLAPLKFVKKPCWSTPQQMNLAHGIPQPVQIFLQNLPHSMLVKPVPHWLLNWAILPSPTWKSCFHWAILRSQFLPKAPETGHPQYVESYSIISTLHPCYLARLLGGALECRTWMTGFLEVTLELFSGFPIAFVLPKIRNYKQYLLFGVCQYPLTL